MWVRVADATGPQAVVLAKAPTARGHGRTADSTDIFARKHPCPQASAVSSPTAPAQVEMVERRPLYYYRRQPGRACRSFRSDALDATRINLSRLAILPIANKRGSQTMDACFATRYVAVVGLVTLAVMFGVVP